MALPETTVSVLRRFDEFLALEAEWRALFAASAEPHSSLRHSWLRLSWTLAWRRPPNRLRIILVREAGELVMAGAFVLGFRGLAPTVWFLTSTMPQYEDVLWRASPNAADHAATLLAALRRELKFPHRLRFERMPAASPFLAALHRAGLSGRAVAAEPVAYLRMADHRGYDGYYAALSHNLRDNHSRRLRRLAEMPGYRLGLETGAEARDTIAWLNDVKRDWLAEKHKTALWLSSGLVDRFLAGLIDSGDAPEIWVPTLRIGPLAAAIIAFVERDRALLFKIAHDPAFGKQSPGRTLAFYLVQLCFERGLAELDLGQLNDWKQRLAPSYRDVADERIWL